MRPTASSICAARSSRVILRVHCDGGFRSTKNSAMLIGFGSVPSSGRPACEMTCVTSGNSRAMRRTWATSRFASETDTLEGSVRLIHSVPSFSSGRNSVPSLGTSSRAIASAATALPMAANGRRSVRSSVRRYVRSRNATSALCSCFTPRPSRKKQRSGTSVSENTSDPTSADETVYAIGAKIRPSWRCSVKIGMCATMMISIENSVGRPTCSVASRIVRRADSRSGEWECRASVRNTFSTTMTAPSTMMPKSIAPSDRRFAGMPRTRRPMNVASSASGMTAATMAAARPFRRNTYSTSVTSSAPSSRLRKTVVSVVEMSCDRS